MMINQPLINVQDMKTVAVDHGSVVHNIDTVLLQPIIEMGMAVDEVTRFVLLNDPRKG
jgi:hypothetical protein